MTTCSEPVLEGDYVKRMCKALREEPYPGVSCNKKAADLIEALYLAALPALTFHGSGGVAQTQQKPAAWGRMIDGEAITVSRIRNGANDEPLYATPASPEQHDAIYLRGWDEGIEAAIDTMPSTAEDPNEDTYQRGRFDGIMEYRRAMRDLSERSLTFPLPSTQK